MGLQTKFEYLKKEFPVAYVKIEVLKWQSVEDEIYTKNGSSDLNMSWKKNPKCTAIFFIYADKKARDNRVNPISQISVTFSYKPEHNMSIFVAAYNALKELPEFIDGIDIFEDVV